jgi:hypothetical protein
MCTSDIYACGCRRARRVPDNCCIRAAVCGSACTGFADGGPFNATTCASSIFCCTRGHWEVHCKHRCSATGVCASPGEKGIVPMG